MSGKEITFLYVWKFLNQKKLQISYFAGISFCCIMILLLAVYWILPETNFYTQEVQITLDSGNANTPHVYPNGKSFNQFDIISTPVLKAVYSRNHMNKMISYQNFSKLFSIIAFVPGRSFLDAQYEQLLNNAKRSLSPTNIKDLEKEYNEKLALLNHNIYSIVMETNSKIPKQLALKIVSEIPQEWMEIYRVTEAKVFPQESFDQSMEKKLREEMKRSHIIAVDRAAYYYEKMMILCNVLNAMRKDRVIALPSGEHLGDLMESLNYVKNYQIDLLRQIIFAGKLSSDMDRLFILGRIQYLEQKKAEKTAEYNAIQNSLQILQDKQEVKTDRGGDKTDKGGTQVNIDASVFSKITEMLRSDAVSEMRKTLSKESLDCGKELAVIESNLKYYTQIYEGITSPKQQQLSRNIASRELDSIFDMMLNNLLMTSRKINAFKELMLKEYSSNTEFYVPVAPSQFSKERAVPTLKLFAFAGGIWILLNLLYLLISFQKDYMRTEPEAKNEPKESV